MWKDSYKKTRKERIDLLKKSNLIDDYDYDYLLNSQVLNDEIADKFIENQISVYGIPFGIATNFLIDNKEYVIPMVIEEPSVIAAACNGAKITKEFGGIHTEINERLMTGQISYYNIDNFQNAKNIILNKKIELLDIANNSQKEIVNLGGGAKDLEVEIKDEFLIVYLHVDTLDAMGANTINTMLEVISPIIHELIGGNKLMSIISNLSTRALVKASCSIKIDEEVGKKIELASKFANTDEYRATTNNKGIFNGIDAFALAIGNDWRAIEAGGHAYAVKDGKYKSLTKWTYINDKLNGEIIIPMPIASFGGSIGINPLSKISLKILGNPNAKELARIAAAIGLIQNFSALRALVTVGIQKGHMKLQIKSLALYLGATNEEIDAITEILKNEKHIGMEEVKNTLENIRK